jgi:two-component system CheB/CheR fusion protein
VSIGLVPITAHYTSAESMLSAGDAACYSARDHGGNQIQVFRPNDTGFVRRRADMLWIGHISEALKNDRFHLYYQELQPLQRERTGIRAEILLKMEDPDGQHVSPSVFLPAAERANLIPEIDRWVVRYFLRWLRANAQRLDQLESASINLSGNTLGEDAVLQFIVGELNEHRAPYGKVCFEITETVAISNLRNAQRLFSTLSQRGCKFSLDDFGSAVSSYGYLKELPVDYVKIDGIFVKEVSSDRVHAKLVQSITDIAHAMGIECVAEYVESAQICDRIAAMGVDYAQGHDIGEARPLDELFDG